jgi:hypothetical protein
LYFLREIFHGVEFHTTSKECSTIIKILIELNKYFNTIYVVVGGDRVEFFKTLLLRYNGIEYDYDNIVVINCGDRTEPDSMSATKARNFALQNDSSSFSGCMPVVASDAIIAELWNELRECMI